MEETMQQETNPELEYKNQNEEEGGIRRRLRDRDLLRKRKAEAEEKETNQLESQRKRSRADYRSGTKKRGRPRKTEAVSQLSVIQEDAAGTQEAPAVILAPEPAALISDLLSSSLNPIMAAEPQPVSFPAVPAPAPAAMLESFQSSVFAPTLISRASVNSALDSSAGPAQDSAQAPAQAPDAAPAPALLQDYVQAAALGPPSALPPQVETLYTESQGTEVLDQVLIEDLGPDEEEDISLSNDIGAEEGLKEMMPINLPQQTKMYSVPTLSSPPLPQEYLPGN